VSDSDVSGIASVPRVSTLDAWSTADWRAGVNVTELAAFDTLTVTTKNSVYTLVVVCPRTGKVEVRGGSAFPSFAPARISGSSLGGGLLKRHVVHAGFCLELLHGDLGTVVTTRVQTVAVRKAERSPSHSVM
jgi:hypothetical protein